MNKQELIDKAVKELKGVLRNHKDYWFENGEMWLYFPEGSFDRLQLCTTDEFTQRARELGWINGYKWGVEYETNGKKPDLPDDVLVKTVDLRGYISTGKVRFFTWERYESFSIVDERYKPVEVEQVQADWFDYDKRQAIALPPVGVECEVSFLKQDFRIFEIRGFYQGKVWLASAETGDIAEMSSNCAFRPLDYNRKVDEEKRKFVETALAVNKMPLVNQDISKEWFGMLYDSGLFELKNKAAL